MLSDFRDEEAANGKKREYGDHDRIKKFYASPDISSLLGEELSRPYGDVMISGSLLAALFLCFTDIF